MPRQGWWYFAHRVHGDGTESLAAADLPLSDPQITTVLSGTDEITFDLTPEIARLKGSDGRPVLRPRATAVYAVLDGQVRAGGLVRSVTADGPTARVACAGYVSYLDGLPWTNTTKKLYGADPADVVRMLWTYAQAHPLGNLAVVVSPDVKTKAKVGVRVAEVKDKTGNVTTQATDEPLLLANYATADLAQVFVEMLDAGSLDFREVHTLTGETVTHELTLGYPRLGRRRTDIQFQVGVNVVDVPTVEFDDEDYASEVLVLAAGEGDKMVRSHAYVPDSDRVRRVQVVPAKSIGRQASADSWAETVAKRARPDEGDVDTLVVAPHPLAPIGSWETGDEVWLSGEALWGGMLGQWVRIMSVTYEPQATPGATLKVVRADRT